MGVFNNDDDKKPKLVKISFDQEEIKRMRKANRRRVARQSANFESLKKSVVKAIYDGDWHVSPGHYLRDEEEVFLNILELIAEEAYIVACIAPLRKVRRVVFEKLDLIEKYKRQFDIKEDFL